MPEPEAGQARRLLPELVLVGITIIWGFTFYVTQIGLTHSGPFFFVGLRFATATLVLAAVSTRSIRAGFTRLELGASLSIGLVMVAVFGFQAAGLLTIPSSKSAFITALYVPLVPLMELFFLQRMPRRMVWIGIVMAFIGLILLAGPEQVVALRLGVGETFTLLCAVAAAAQIVLIGLFADRIDTRRAALIQLGTVSIGCFALMPVFGERVPSLSAPLFLTTGGLGVASALIQVAMNWGQRSVAPSRATLIYAGEPIWAGLIGRVAGERLPGIALIGAALIIGGVIVSELKISRKPKIVPA
ncbi:EamA family transporter [Sphingomonas oleivorans]|uniref:EamA family transporter n=1 Tax=Sphingomonas oleivorans TaxID=1735121 RepID=A0A2T5FX42_9SPHN|nr:EamA family transporter [Sphingomonas oleivorans]